MKKQLLLFLLPGCLIARSQQFTLIKDINPGSATSNISYLTNVNNTLFFAANDGVNGMELWKSNGTNAGTVLVKDIRTGSGSASIGYLTAVNSTLFFVANNGTNGTELWKSDGTDAGTVMVKDIRLGSLSSNPSNLVEVNGVLYFSADNGINGSELWKSDGTAAGTVMVKDISTIGGSYPQSLVNVNNTLFFAADNGIKGVELWKSDGTSSGTVLVKDIWSGMNSASPFDLTAIGNTLYFSGSDGSAGTELWKSDGTAAGTTLVKDVWAGSNDGYPYDLVNVGGTLYFSANNGSNGIELWKSDGTTSGTMLVKDVWPGSSNGAAGNFSKFINKLVFTGNDGVNGYKTWQSDGTIAGTKIATGLIDVGSGSLEQIAETDTKIFASINQSSTGSELWAVNFSLVLPLDFIEFKGELLKNDGVLNWKTANEVNALEFIVERSVNGSRYETVGRVAAGSNNYKFIDENVTALKANTIYYRLKQVDVDSRFTYSKVIALSIDSKAKISLFPNPAINEINVQMGIATDSKVQYKIMDNAGKVVDKQIASGTNFTVDINSLSKGVYYIGINSDVLNKTIRFVKQ